MKKLETEKVLVFLFMLFVLSACQKEKISPAPAALTADGGAEAWQQERSNGCNSYFFYDQKQKVSLGTVLNDSILIGFQKQLSHQQVDQIIATFPFLLPRNSSFFYDSHIDNPYKIAFVPLQPGLSCQDLHKKLRQLEQHPEIGWAAPFIFSPFAGGAIRPEVGITDEFLVMLKPDATRCDIEQLVRISKTQILEEIFPQFYLLSADKNSIGDAMDMVTFYTHSQKVESAELNLLYSLHPFRQSNTKVVSSISNKLQEMVR